LLGIRAEPRGTGTAGQRAFAAALESDEGSGRMASSAKKKTTFAKLNRENKLRERRREKEARKQSRKQEAASRRDAPADTPPAGES
jgi:hypothetical protein